MKENKKMKISFIGGGNMGEALMSSILRAGLFPAARVGVHEPDSVRLKKLVRKLRIQSFRSNRELVERSETIVLAVKPQQIGSVLQEIGGSLKKSPLVISIAAGIDTAYFQKRLPPGTRLIRAMPNLCAMVGEAASALYATPAATGRDRQLSLRIFSAAGKAIFVEKEEWLDLVTALSGSGPAFVFLFLDALIDAGEKLGLPARLGNPLVLQTVLGSVKVVQSSSRHNTLPSLIEKVASKGGTTEAGLAVLARLGFREIIRDTIATAAQRARELREGS